MINNPQNNYYEAMAKLTFAEKIQMSKRVIDFTTPSMLNTQASILSYDGYLTTVTDKTVRVGEGSHGVYLWKHAWGDPFYVGSGKGDRWKNRSSRCDDFFLHIDQGDAVVYMVLDGVDAATARAYERYVSVNLSRAGYTLANGDNNFEYATESLRHTFLRNCAEIEGDELTRRVEVAVLEILCHDPKCDYRITEAFLMSYGTDYFSQNHWRDKHRRAGYKSSHSESHPTG